MELFRLLGTIAINNDGANAAIDGTTQKAEKSESKVSNAFGKIGSAAVKMGKVVATGMAVCGTAIAGLTKKAMDGYADYEQLVGGVETLFKESADVVEEYANKAYKSAGLSANEYMETVTSFSASLLQSLDNDTASAAEKANLAIIDMSDNANKMGTSMESIQNAYQGFAKQNYTMLDNLKLGYGGTKEEMQRLLQDASKISNVEYDLSNFGDIVDAIHVIQEEMGIAGTTAKEASATISGSFSAMKSSWSNLLAGMGKEDADIGGLIDEFVDSALVVADNVVPRIEVILDGMTKAIGKIVPKITSKLPSLLNSLLPPLIEGAAALFNGLVAALPSLVQVLIEQVPYIIEQIGGAIVNAVPQLFGVVKQVIGQLWDFISLELMGTDVSFDDAVSSIFESDGFGTLSKTFESVKKTILPLIDAFKNLGGAIMGEIDGPAIFQEAFSLMADGISAVWSTVGQPVYQAMTDGINWLAENWIILTSTMKQAFGVLWDGCQTVWTNIGQPIWDMISIVIGVVVDLFRENMPAIMKFFTQATSGIKDTWENHLKPIFEAIGDFLNNTLKPAFKFVFGVIIGPLISNVFGLIADLWNGTLKPIFDGICDFLLGTFTGNWKKAFQGIVNIVQGIFGGIVSVIQRPLNTAKDIVNKAIDFIKEKFNFKWEFPKLKMPHFKISGSFSLNPPSVPSFGIEWYKKAMDDPMIMDTPTAFGINAKGQIMAGGEAGSEVVSGTETLMNMISAAVAAQNEALLNVLLQILEAILAMDGNMGENLRDALDGVSLGVNNREFARMVKAVK